MRAISLLVVTTLCTVLTLPAAEQPAWQDNQFPAWASPLQAGAKVVEGGTEIRWLPEPYRFEAGDSRRYIDFEGGTDSSDGLTPATAWKHHPWDAQATAQAAAGKGVHSYIFKGGVIYRGALVARDSGSASEPIRLTRDPAWGEGPATIAGSEAVSGWQRAPADAVRRSGSQNHSLPDEARAHLWVAPVPGDFVPSAAWTLSASGERARLTLARWPNWQITHPYNIFTQWHRVEKINTGFPNTSIYAPKVLNDPDRNAFKGATVWMDHANTSGEFSIIGPFPSPALGYDPDSGRLLVTFTHPRRHPQPGAPFYLENMPGFLDQAGEWWFDRDEHKLYVWLPGDGDPRQSTVELAHHRVIIDIPSQRHIEIAGLTLTGGNSIDLNKASRFRQPEPVWEQFDGYTQMAAIRLHNASSDIVMRHLAIEHTAGTGISNLITDEGVAQSEISLRDSSLQHIDNDGLRMRNRSAPSNRPNGRIEGVTVYRNRMHDIGMRSSVDQGGRGIDINGLTLGDIAGNVISRTGGQGINIVGGRRGEHVPLIRIQIRENQVKDTLFQKSDFGGIEFWGHGPTYVYNNISINPIGIVAHRGAYHKNECYYFDHGFKGYLFNNFGWSEARDDAHRGVVGDHFFKEVRNRWNMAFHNTAYNMRAFQSHEGRHGDQQYYLGNLAINMRGKFLSFWRLDEAESIGYGNNVFAGEYNKIYDRWHGDAFATIDETRAHIEGLGNHVTQQVGWVTDDQPVVDAESHDFRLADSSAAIDRGVQVFVPWGLYGNVGEWHFRHQPKDPNTVLSDALYSQAYHGGNGDLMLGTELTSTALEGDGFNAEDYRPGILENWNRGALQFDGSKSMRIPHARLAADVVVQVKDKDPKVTPASERHTVSMTDNNFLIEAVFRAEQGGGEIVAKLAEGAGYALGVETSGQVRLILRANGSELSLRTRAQVLDGRWHHVVAEVDRAAAQVQLYLDGARVDPVSTGAMPAAGQSLLNEADFVVGAGWHGALDFLRLSRGTLADAQTSFEELMSWQFNGPHLHDFLGRAASGEARDVGALEHPGASGRQPINYTPPASAVDAIAQAPTDVFLDGAGRTVKAVEWGSVSVPERASVGSEIIVQVVFGTETIDRPQHLRIDLHGFMGRKRVPGLARSTAIRVMPGVTTPYTARITIPKREGLSRVAAVVYATNDGWSGKTVSTEVGFEIGEPKAVEE
ncbi:MAG: hypothetical protein PF961_11990 [Planctomycetota bacterium]|jgi:hypothetical protein|nr:hypothetical protein [Planctomycetota bacterium]